MGRGRVVIAVNAHVVLPAHIHDVHRCVNLVAVPDNHILVLAHSGQKIPFHQIVQPFLLDRPVLLVKTGMIARHADKANLIKMIAERGQKLRNQLGYAHNLLNQIFFI